MAESNTRSQPRYRDELGLINYFVDQLERRLAGRHESRILRIIPSDHCHLGVLGPRDPLVEEPEVGEHSEEAESDAPTTETLRSDTSPRPDPAKDDTAETSELDTGQAEQVEAERRRSGTDSARRPPSSIGFEIVVAPNGEADFLELRLVAEFAVYTQHFPTYEEQLQEVGRHGDQPVANSNQAEHAAQGTNPGETPTNLQGHPRDRVSLIEVFIRHNLTIPPTVFRIPIGPNSPRRLTDEGALQLVLDAALDEAAQDRSIWRTIDTNATVPVRALESKRTFEEFLRQIGSGPVSRPPLRASLDVRTNRLPDGQIRIRCYLRNDTLRDTVNRYRDQYHILADARLSGALNIGVLTPIEILPIPADYQFDRRVWAIGHGASAVVSEDHRTISTEALARYAQPRRTTRLDPPAKFTDLIEQPIQYLEQIRQSMITYANDWEQRIVNRNESDLSAEDLIECRGDLEAFRDEEARFAEGIAALNADDRLLNAFVAMNRVFARIAGDRYNRWRLFQIVFIVMQLTSLAVREGVNSGEWPSGFQRRWDGALECADVLWFPTGGGKTEAYLGLISCAALYDRLRGKRFGVTAWLRFPLRMLSVQQLQRAAVVLWETEQERTSLLGNKASESDRISLGYFVGEGSTPNILRADDSGRWPFRAIEQDPEVRDKLLLISNCPACKAIGSMQIVADRPLLRIRHVCTLCKTELPIYVSDDEVYRFLPTVIVGTVDKMAAIAYNPKFAMLWGGASWRCPEHPDHGYGLGDWCINGCPRNPGKGKKAKQRAVLNHYDAGPSFHIQDELHLLQQELGAFAGHYETLVRWCETTVAGRPPKIVAATATIEGFEHQLQHIYGVRQTRRFPVRGYDLFETFYTTTDRDLEDTNAPAKTMRVYVAFRPPHLHAADAAALCTRLIHEQIIYLGEHPNEAAGWLPYARTEREIQDLLYYYTTTLTYVGAKARGVRIRQALEREAGRLRPNGVRDLTTEFLSGDSNLATIASVIRKVEAPPDWTDDQYLDATIATNVISHGVDVERFNLMVMDSVPEEAADYIQASSRCGRAHVGLVMAVLPSYSLRASSIYHRFKEFHTHLERLVSPVPVNRFAKYAADRTIPGIFVGLLLGSYGARQHGSQLNKRFAAAQLFALPATSRQFQSDVETAYGLNRDVYPPGLESAMRENLQYHVQRLQYLIRGSHQERVVDVLQPKPMTSLRDVDVGVPFRVSDGVEWPELQWFDRQRS